MKNIIKKILKEELDLTKPVVVFVGGLDSGSKYKPIKEQTEILISGLGYNFTVIPHRYTEVKAAKESIIRNPNCYVVLFSAGCSKSNSIASLVTDKSKMYIVDPYSCDSNTKDNVINSGVSEENILGTIGNNCTGNNVAGTKRSCKGFKDILECHWDGLRVVGVIIASRY